MNERYFLTPRNSIGNNGLEAMGDKQKDGLKAMGDKQKDGLKALGNEVKDGLKALGNEVKTGLVVFAISLSISVILGLRRSRNVGYVFVKTVNRNVSH